MPSCDSQHVRMLLWHSLLFINLLAKLHYAVLPQCHATSVATIALSVCLTQFKYKPDTLTQTILCHAKLLH